MKDKTRVWLLALCAVCSIFFCACKAKEKDDVIIPPDYNEETEEEQNPDEETENGLGGEENGGEHTPVEDTPAEDTDQPKEEDESIAAGEEDNPYASGRVEME